ncbi:MAG: 6-bladed beta-propeller, partial [Gammaproteobacteria bacterium]|nr:6-bladed beta-propeller [Gammaproteobacteria bacterium]
MKRFVKFFLILPFLSPLVMNGCATQSVSEAVPIPVFPSPPDDPRITYERTLFSSADVEVESEESAFKRFVTGARRTGIALGKPFGVTVHQGRVFVSDTVKRQVFAFDVRNGTFLEIGTKAPGQLIKPMGLDVDSQGTVYVCDASLKQVLVFDRDGKYLRRFGKVDLFDRPAGLTVNPEGDRVFVVDTGGVTSERHRVLVFDTQSGELLNTISRRGSGEGELNLPREATIGKDDNLYVVDGGNFRVQVFSQTGKFIRSFGDIGRRSGQFSRPKGIGVDPDGNVYVADTAFGNFQIFNPEGQVLLAVGSRNSVPGPARFMLPAG